MPFQQEHAVTQVQLDNTSLPGVGTAFPVVMQQVKPQPLKI
jgi:hypothetical protein